MVDVMPHYLSLELRGHSIPWSEIQEVHFPDRTAAWSKLEPSQSSEFREGALVWGGLSLAAAARWFGHPPLQTVAQGHHTLGEPREERALAPKHLDAEERLVRQPESALMPAPRVFDLAAFCVPSRLPQLGQESLEHLQAQEGAHAEERSRLGSGRMAAADAAADEDADTDVDAGAGADANAEDAAGRSLRVRSKTTLKSSTHVIRRGS